MKILGPFLFALALPVFIQAAPQKAEFLQVEGKVRVERGGWERYAQKGLKVQQGDIIRGESDSARAVLKSNAGHEFRLKGKTHIRLDRFTKNGTSHRTLVSLLQGKIWMAVAKLKTSKSTFEVEAGGVVCGVRGTVFSGEYDDKGRKGRYSNHEGKVDLIDKMKMPMAIPLRHFCNFKDGSYTDTRPMTKGDLREFKW